MAGGEQNKMSPAKISAAERRAKALEMRKGGMTYDAIGKNLGISQVAAYKHVKRALTLLVQEPLEEYRKVEFERLSIMLRAIWPKVLAGNEKSIETGLKISQRICRLMGLDAPLKVDYRGITLAQLIIGDGTPPLDVLVGGGNGNLKIADHSAGANGNGAPAAEDDAGDKP